MIKVFLLYGPPGSGKGTQGKNIENYWAENNFNWASIKIGYLLRKYIEDKEGVGISNLKNIMYSGSLVPSAFPIMLIAKEIAYQKTLPDFLLLDGGVRKSVEVGALFEVFSILGEVEVHCIVLEFPCEKILDRLKIRGRRDDTETVIRTRIEEWQNDTDSTRAALMNIDGKTGVTMHIIDGDSSIEEVYKKIKTVIV